MDILSLIGIFGIRILVTTSNRVLSGFVSPFGFKKGIKNGILDFIFLIEPVTICIMSPIIAMILPKLGRKQIFLGSSIVYVSIYLANRHIYDVFYS